MRRYVLIACVLLMVLLLGCVSQERQESITLPDLNETNVSGMQDLKDLPDISGVKNITTGVFSNPFPSEPNITD